MTIWSERYVSWASQSFIEEEKHFFEISNLNDRLLTAVLNAVLSSWWFKTCANLTPMENRSLNQRFPPYLHLGRHIGQCYETTLLAVLTFQVHTPRREKGPLKSLCLSCCLVLGRVILWKGNGLAKPWFINRTYKLYKIIIYKLHCDIQTNLSMNFCQRTIFFRNNIDAKWFISKMFKFYNIQYNCTNYIIMYRRIWSFVNEQFSFANDTNAK